jgi:hypothetical protein
MREYKDLEEERQKSIDLILSLSREPDKTLCLLESLLFEEFQRGKESNG